MHPSHNIDPEFDSLRFSTRVIMKDAVDFYVQETAILVLQDDKKTNNHSLTSLRMRKRERQIENVLLARLCAGAGSGLGFCARGFLVRLRLGACNAVVERGSEEIAYGPSGDEATEELEAGDGLDESKSGRVRSSLHAHLTMEFLDDRGLLFRQILALVEKIFAQLLDRRLKAGERVEEVNQSRLTLKSK